MPLTRLLPFMLFLSCSTAIENRNPLNETFPSVLGTNLEGAEVDLPKDIKGKHAILLIGYIQNAQFDIDRWILGFTDSKVSFDIYEIPTIPGMFPRMLSGYIDNGMRSGIPKELWEDVITVYGKGAKKITSFTGNERPLNARVIVLDPEGKVIFFHDRGYSIPHLKSLINSLP